MFAQFAKAAGNCWRDHGQRSGHRPCHRLGRPAFTMKPRGNVHRCLGRTVILLHDLRTGMRLWRFGNLVKVMLKACNDDPRLRHLFACERPVGLHLCHADLFAFTGLHKAVQQPAPDLWRMLCRYLRHGWQCALRYFRAFLADLGKDGQSGINGIEPFLHVAMRYLAWVRRPIDDVRATKRLFSQTVHGVAADIWRARHLICLGCKRAVRVFSGHEGSLAILRRSSPVPSGSRHHPPARRRSGPR